MNAHPRRTSAPALPPFLAQMVRRVDSATFQIVGLPEGIEDRTFRDRAQAEGFLARHQDLLIARKKIGYRPCLCCRVTFLSTGPQNRLCDTCRVQT